MAIVNKFFFILFIQKNKPKFMEIRKEIGVLLDSLVEDQMPRQTLPPGLYKIFSILNFI